MTLISGGKKNILKCWCVDSTYLIGETINNPNHIHTLEFVIALIF